MVKNRNWETRTEIAEARRVATRQRKQRRENKKGAKSMVYDLFNMMDRHCGALQRRSAEGVSTTIHIWTDTEHSDGPSLEEILLYQRYATEEKKLKQRRRSSSFNEASPKSRKGRTRRSCSFSESGSGKKTTRKNSMDEEEVDAPRLCRDQFFNGECKNFQRKNGCCNHVHYGTDLCPSLASVLQSDESLTMSLDAAVAGESLIDTAVDPEEGGMEMVYYFSIELFDKGDNDQSISVSEAISKALFGKSCGLGSMVYVAIGKVLVFDRNRDGLIMSDNGFAVAVLGDKSRRLRSVSVESHGAENQTCSEDASENDNDECYELQLLPGPLLEYILTFLPVPSVRVMTEVCRVWSREIGTNSPSLWKHLLQRRKFPSPDESTMSEENARDAYRNEYIKHHGVMRNVKAIGTATAALTSLPGRPAISKEFVMQSFSSRRGAPQEPNCCVGIKIWSPHRVLVAYDFDCTLRLFETVAKPVSEDNDSSPRSCKEVLCLRVANNSRRKTWTLFAFDFDDDMIGCLCRASTEEKDSSFLIVIGREDFLCANGHVEEGTAHVINLGEALLNYILSSDVVDHSTLRLLDYIGEHGLASLDVNASTAVTACGYGRFMVEMSISVDGDDLLVLDRKLVLVSAAAGAIVWMGSTYDAQVDELSLLDMTLSHAQFCLTRGRLTTCTLVAASRDFEEVVLVDVDSAGHVSQRRVSDAISEAATGFLVDDWDTAYVVPCPRTLTPTDIVHVKNLWRERGGKIERKALLMFYPYAAATSEVSGITFELEGMTHAARMESFGDEHVVVLVCVSEVAHDGDFEFRQESMNAVVVHVPTRQVLGRIRLYRNVDWYIPQNPEIHTPLFLDVAGDTIGVGYAWKGVVMTGETIRSVGYENQLGCGRESNSAKKKKKKKGKGNKRGNKKDAFVRGISLSG